MQASSLSSHYAELVFSYPLPRPLVYEVPKRLSKEICAGQAVWVRLGKRLAVGWIWCYPAPPPLEDIDVQEILAVVEDKVHLHKAVRSFYQAFCDFYMALEGELIRHALPSALQKPVALRLCLGEVPPTDARLAHAFDKKKELSLSSFLRQTAALPDEIAQWFRQRELDYCLKASLPARVQLAKGLDSTTAAKQCRTLKQQAILKQVEGYAQEGCTTTELIEDPLSGKAVKQLLARGLLSPAPSLPRTKPFSSSGSSILYPCALEDMPAGGWIDIQAQLAAGAFILWLLPSTEALVARRNYLKKAGFVSFSCYHGQLTTVQQKRIWQSVAEGHQHMVLAVRKGVFLPFSHLDHIIVEEDIEAQHESHKRISLRYHTREAALLLAKCHGACTHLFSAAPSLESMRRLWEGKHLQGQVPKGVRGPRVSLLSGKQGDLRIWTTLSQALKENKQALVFYPHKGSGHYLLCGTCKEVARCPSCQTTYAELTPLCRHCNTSLSTHCLHCKENHWQRGGGGSEWFAERLALAFPKLALGRWERSAEQKAPNRELLRSFFEKKIQLLLATPHLLYGWQQRWTGVVVVYDCEKLLYRPSFRAAEHLMQWLHTLQYQLGNKTIDFFVHTSTKQGHRLLSQLLAGGYEHFIRREAHERKALALPPYGTRLRVKLSHQREEKLESAAADFKAWAGRQLPQASLVAADDPPSPTEAKKEAPTTTFILQIKGLGPRSLLMTWRREALMRYGGLKCVLDTGN